MSHALAVHPQPTIELRRQAATRLPERGSPAAVIEAANFYDVEERDLVVVPGHHNE